MASLRGDGLGRLVAWRCYSVRSHPIVAWSSLVFSVSFIPADASLFRGDLTTAQFQSVGQSASQSADGVFLFGRPDIIRHVGMYV